METSFDQIEREHRRERLSDASRMGRRKVMPQDLQEENSLLPSHIDVQVADLAQAAKRLYPVTRRELGIE